MKSKPKPKIKKIKPAFGRGAVTDGALDIDTASSDCLADSLGFDRLNSTRVVLLPLAEYRRLRKIEGMVIKAMNTYGVEARLNLLDGIGKVVGHAEK